MDLKQENEILKKTLNDIIDIDQGIYPLSVQGGDNDYEKRTQYMDGWNDALIENMKRVCKVLDKNGVSIINDEVLIKREKSSFKKNIEYFQKCFNIKKERK